MRNFIATLILASIGCTIVLTPVKPGVKSTQPVSVFTPRHIQSQPVSPVSILATVTALRSVNVRREPTEHSEDVGDLWHGEEVVILGCVGTWAKIETGYVNSKYLGGICNETPKSP